MKEFEHFLVMKERFRRGLIKNKPKFEGREEKPVKLETPRESPEPTPKKRWGVSCDFCGNLSGCSKFKHVNICSTESDHRFCSKECKANWMKERRLEAMSKRERRKEK